MPIFVACTFDENFQPANTLVCQREHGIGRIRGYVINGHRFSIFDRDGNGLGEDKGYKIMWSGERPDHVAGYDALINWFKTEVYPTLPKLALPQPTLQ